MPHLLEQIRERAAVGERVLVTTLTKRLAEDLSFYLSEQGVRCKWLHSELDAFERVELLRDLREGRFDALVGVNLLREGLDLPEVSLVAILDADKEGFLRSETSLMQTIGRAARNVNAKVHPVRRQGDRLDAAGDRRNRPPPRDCRRNTTASTASRPRRSARAFAPASKPRPRPMPRPTPRWAARDEAQYITEEYLAELEGEMMAAAEALEFERAATIRDRIEQMREIAWAAKWPTSTCAAPPRARAAGAAAAADGCRGRSGKAAGGRFFAPGCAGHYNLVSKCDPPAESPRRFQHRAWQQGATLLGASCHAFVFLGMVRIQS